jgi:hypothetical protein
VEKVGRGWVKEEGEVEVGEEAKEVKAAKEVKEK